MRGRDKTGDAHMAAVGRVASHWAGFEALLDLFTIAMADIPRETGYCFTAQVIGPARKIDAYISIVRLRGAVRFIRELEAFAKDTIILAERRNRIVHDPWLYSDDKKTTRYEVTARRTLRMLHVEVPTADVLRLLSEINGHRDRLIELDDRIRAALDT